MDDRDASSADLDHPPKPTRSAFSIRRLIGAGLILLWVTGGVLRLTIRDQMPLLSVWFYCTPPVVLAVSAIVAGGLLFLRNSRRGALIAIALGLACGGWWWASSFFHNEVQFSRDSVRVLLWNCQHGYHGWKPLAEQIHRIDAPLIGLVEAGGHTQQQRDFWRWEFVDYDVATPGGGIVLMTRGTVIRSKLVSLAGRGRCGEFEVAIDGRQVTVLVVDIASNPFISRRQALHALSELIDAHGSEPLLIMGDFNIPTDSVFLDRLRLTCVNAFEAAGNGNSATWPSLVPVLSLDQVWTRGPLRAANCRHLRNSKSDHLQVVTELSFRPVATPESGSR
jgi:endonuclease/exonuclease/phosphatase (EEP) superfamily protein YafD